MQVLYERCCGVDVHKKSVKACLFTPDSKGKRRKEIQTFGTMTAELLQLFDWLVQNGCTHVAMESTGPYWKPIYNLLEGTFELVLANALEIKNVPGRKTDVGDSEWIADLLQHGLIRGSFVPPRPIRELRELTQYRKALIQERGDEVNRVQKVLEGANIKLSSVATDVLGVSGRAILEEIIAGNTNSETMAQLAKGRLRKKIPELQQALAGRVGGHQRFLLAQQLAHIDFMDEAIERCSLEIVERMRPFADKVERLRTIPGVEAKTAETILAALGPDMSVFPTHKHAASWAGLCPGNNESAGKRKSGKTRKGNHSLREALVEAAKSVSRTRNTYLSAQYHRIAARRGPNRAAVAVAHSILIIAYHLLKEGGTYQELGPTYFDEIDRERVRRRLVTRLETLGYKVSLESQPAPTPAA